MNQSRSKYEIVQIHGAEVVVDISMLKKSDALFFNATEIAKQFGKLPKDFLKTESTRDYIEALSEYSGKDNSPFQNYVKVTKGGKHQGTWLHNDLALEFAGWCSATFRLHLHKWVESKIQEEHNLKQLRDTLRTGYLPLSKAIEAAHDETKFYHYINEADLVNGIVLGMKSKSFKAMHGVDDIRDACDAWQMHHLDKLQRINTGLIELGMAYDERKERLLCLMEKESALVEAT